MTACEAEEPKLLWAIISPPDEAGLPATPEEVLRPPRPLRLLLRGPKVPVVMGRPLESSQDGDWRKTWLPPPPRASPELLGRVTRVRVVNSVRRSAADMNLAALMVAQQNRTAGCLR